MSTAQLFSALSLSSNVSRKSQIHFNLIAGKNSVTKIYITYCNKRIMLHDRNNINEICLYLTWVRSHLVVSYWNSNLALPQLLLAKLYEFKWYIARYRLSIDVLLFVSKNWCTKVKNFSTTTYLNSYNTWLCMCIYIYIRNMFVTMTLNFVMRTSLAVVLKWN